MNAFVLSRCWHVETIVFHGRKIWEKKCIWKKEVMIYIKAMKKHFGVFIQRHHSSTSVSVDILVERDFNCSLLAFHRERCKNNDDNNNNNNNIDFNITNNNNNSNFQSELLLLMMMMTQLEMN